MTTASHVSALHHLDIRYLVKSNSNVKFIFTKLRKSWHTARQHLLLTIVGFPENPQLCVAEILDKYLEMTKDKGGWIKRSYCWAPANYTMRLSAALYQVGLKKKNFSQY